MNASNYLSQARSPEFNLNVLAQHKSFLTKDLAIQIANQKENDSHIHLSEAVIIGTLAVGIILGFSYSVALGTCVTIAAVIPLVAWRNFKDKNLSIEMEIDKEKEKLEEICQQMVASVKGKHQFLQIMLKQTSGTVPYQKGDEDDTHLDEYFLKTKEDILKSIFDSNRFSKISELCKAFKKSQHQLPFSPKEHDLLTSTLASLEANNSDIQADLHIFFKDAQFVAHSKSKPVVLEDKWKELQQACKEISRPFSSYFKVENGVYVYQD